MHLESTRGKMGTGMAATSTRVAATIVLATCGLVGALAPAALALPGSSVDTYYYSTAAKTKLVGHGVLTVEGGQDQHQPASSRAMATVAMVPRFLRVMNFSH